MIAGHFATALLADQHAEGRRFPASLSGWFIVVSQIPDLLWFVFHFLGLEPTEPLDLFDTTLQSLSVEMAFSHHLVPILGWTLLLGVLGAVLFQSRRVGLATAALVGVHALMDYLSGHPHHLFGADTAEIGLGLYDSAPYVAIAIEAVITVALALAFFREERRRGVVRSAVSRRAIIGVLAFGIVFLVSTATTSMREMLGLPAFDLPFGTTVPTLALTYLSMGLVLWAAVRRRNAPATRSLGGAA
ncbi:hypothetical protein [Rubrivirga sp. IMCC43871]|uniref:hypothetical protein n=1 Tax=Rubrivirga sp. IMCC43871 TaxID=3391575 RepID=UPI00398FD9BA